MVKDTVSITISIVIERGPSEMWSSYTFCFCLRSTSYIVSACLLVVEDMADHITGVLTERSASDMRIVGLCLLDFASCFWDME